MDQIPFPKNTEELPRYQTDISKLASAACQAAKDSHQTTSQSSSQLGIFKPAKNDTQSSPTSSGEKSDPDQKEEEDDNRPII